MSDNLIFKIEGDELRVYERTRYGKDFLKTAGPLGARSDDEILQIIYRAVNIGTDHKAAKIRAEMGAK